MFQARFRIFFQCCSFIVAFFILEGIIAQEYRNVDSLLQEYHKRPNDTIKVRLGSLISQNLTYTDPEKAYEYAHEMVSISKEINYKLGISLGYNNLGSYFLNTDQLDSTQYYRQLNLDLVTELQNIGGIITANTQFAHLYRKKNELDKAKEYLFKNIALFENRDTIKIATEKGFKYIGSTYHQLASINLLLGQYNLALKNQLKSLELYKERANDPLFEADAYTALGETEMELGNYQQSIIYCEQALAVYEDFKDLVWQCNVLKLMGKNLISQHKPKKASEYLLEALKISEENNFQLNEANINKLLGDAYMKFDQHELALQHLKKSLEVYGQMENPTEINKTYTSLGQLQNEIGQPSRAIPYLEKAILISDSLKTIPESSKAYFERSRSYTHLHDYKRAFEDFKIYAALKDSIFDTKNSQQIVELRTIFDTETKEQQIALQEKEITVLEQEASISNLQKILLFIGLLLSLIGFYALRQKMKRNKLEREKINAELEFKKKELTTHALNLARKNETLENLKLKAQELKEKENTGTGYNQLIQSINFDLQDDNNWENFSRYFEEVHKDFNSNIKTKYPQVTSNELRLLALLKMNMSSKEIANILNISAEGVKKARYRLRKKLDIASDDSLQDLVLSL